MTDAARKRAKADIVRLARQHLDLVTFWRASSEVLARVVPHFMTPCWYTLDPASLLVTSHYGEEVPEIPPEWLAHEYFADDVLKFADVVRSERGAATIHEATGGDPTRSPAWDLYVRPFGADQELLVALRTRAGDAWGLVGLYREPGRSRFAAEEIDFLRELSPYLAEGARRGLLMGAATDPEGPAAPGLVILREDWSVESLTPGTQRWLEELPDGDWAANSRLPTAVLAVAGRVLRNAQTSDAPHDGALARVRSRAGRWLDLHGAVLSSDDARRVAVIIEPAHPARIASLLMAAYGLTEREQDVTSHVLQGHATIEIARRLGVAPQTVQQHLKSVFEKVDVRSRRELVGTVFFDHYEPRVRDNERRVPLLRPLRGGPLARSEREPVGP